MFFFTALNITNTQCKCDSWLKTATLMDIRITEFGSIRVVALSFISPAWKCLHIIERLCLNHCTVGGMFTPNQSEQLLVYKRISNNLLLNYRKTESKQGDRVLLTERCNPLRAPLGDQCAHLFACDIKLAHFFTHTNL